jgi:hypothetical protein
MTTFYRLDTACGSYHVLQNGDIVRLDIPGFKPSGQWKFLGLCHARRNLFVPFPGCFARPLPFPLNWKNGRAQWRVVDLDHGTRREWASPQGPLRVYTED